ncbi:MFS transporter [Candidatus Bathyarchaeota archaeon]|nr:MFS transporter [Candidatus Bathyarchaeota archaeon]
MDQDSSEKSSAGRLLVPSLTAAYFSQFIVDFLTSVFLLDIAITFFGSSDPVSVAAASQLVTVSCVVAVVFGLLLGVLSVRFSHKKVLFAGSLCTTLGALGCFLAPNFMFMQIFYSIEGIGSMAVCSMAFVLVGELVVLSERPKATGWILAGPVLAGLAGSLLASFFFSGAGGWRSFLLWFALPISLISLAFAYFGVPSSAQKQAGAVGKGAYLSGFKQVFLKKSVASCLIGNVIKMAGAMWIVYFTAFFMTRFGLPLASGALAFMGLTVVIFLGHIVGGYIVNRTGRKRLLVISLIVYGAMLVLTAFVPDLWVALAINFLGTFIAAFGMPAMFNLTLEQAPESRGTVMSINQVLATLGNAIGVALAGAALALFNYTGLLLTFAAMQLLAAAVYVFLTKDPCITIQPDSLKPKPS